MRSSTDIEIEAHFFFWAALLLLTVPLNWLMAAFFAAAVHEFSHILFIRILGYRIWAIRIGIGGTVIQTEPMSCGKELLCALAGPMGSFLLALTIHPLPEAALCALVQGGYNLIPVYPMDGGRILRCIVCLLFPKAANRLCAILEGVASVSIAVILTVLSFRYQLGSVPMLLAVVLLIKTFPRKIPCKQEQLKVQ